MVYYPKGSKEDEIIDYKIENFNEEDNEENMENNFENEKIDTKEGRKMFNPSKKKIKKVFGLVFLTGFIACAIFFYKIYDFGKGVTTDPGQLFNIFNKLETSEDGQLNLLLIGMRGREIPGGGLLADSIMVVALRPEENKVAMISIPRDLYVEIPGKNYSRKINETYQIGEEQGVGQGLDLMKETVSKVTGMDIHYAASVDFLAFKDTIDALGGITIHLDKPFAELDQFVEGGECGGEFRLPAGDVTLDGETALCYTRARFNSSDFDRARRQQEVLMAIKEKAMNLGMLSDIGKIKKLLDVAGDNVKTDISSSGEMKKLYSLYTGMEDPKMYKKVFDTSKEGLLYSTSNGSYILKPVGDSFDQIHQACENIWQDGEDPKEGEEEEGNSDKAAESKKEYSQEEQAL
jgi:LCP family protein required for cell wall assembly